MSVMRLISSYSIRKPSFNFVGLSVPKIWLIFGHGVKRPGVLGVCVGTQASYCYLLIFC